MLVLSVFHCLSLLFRLPHPTKIPQCFTCLSHSNSRRESTDTSSLCKKRWTPQQLPKPPCYPSPVIKFDKIPWHHRSPAFFQLHIPRILPSDLFLASRLSNPQTLSHPISRPLFHTRTSFCTLRFNTLRFCCCVCFV